MKGVCALLSFYLIWILVDVIKPLEFPWDRAREICRHEGKIMYDNVNNPTQALQLMRERNITSMWVDIKWIKQKRWFDGNISELRLSNDGYAPQHFNCVIYRARKLTRVSCTGEAGKLRPVLCVRKDQVLICNLTAAWYKAPASCEDIGMDIYQSNIPPKYVFEYNHCRPDISRSSGYWVGLRLQWIQVGSKTNKENYEKDVVTDWDNCKITNLEKETTETCGVLVLNSTGNVNCLAVPCTENHSYVCKNSREPSENPYTTPPLIYTKPPGKNDSMQVTAPPVSHSVMYFVLSGSLLFLVVVVAIAVAVYCRRRKISRASDHAQALVSTSFYSSGSPGEENIYFTIQESLPPLPTDRPPMPLPGDKCADSLQPPSLINGNCHADRWEENSFYNTEKSGRGDRSPIYAVYESTEDNKDMNNPLDADRKGEKAGGLVYDEPWIMDSDMEKNEQSLDEPKYVDKQKIRESKLLQPTINMSAGGVTCDQNARSDANMDSVPTDGNVIVRVEEEEKISHHEWEENTCYVSDSTTTDACSTKSSAQEAACAMRSAVSGSDHQSEASTPTRMRKKKPKGRRVHFAKPQQKKKAIIPTVKFEAPEVSLQDVDLPEELMIRNSPPKQLAVPESVRTGGSLYFASDESESQSESECFV